MVAGLPVVDALTGSGRAAVAGTRVVDVFQFGAVQGNVPGDAAAEVDAFIKGMEQALAGLNALAR